MIELVIARSGSTPQRLRLSAGTYVMGRAEQADIVLDDKEVSRKHAQLLIDGDTVFVRDLGSGNGTFIGGRSVRESVVAPGAEIDITPFSISFTVVGAAPAGGPFLEGIDGPAAGRRFPLKGDAMSIGRHEEQDIHLDDVGASRNHAMLIRRGETWSVRDNGSANGLFLNGQRVRDGILRAGDVVRIGNSRLRFVLPSDEQEVDLDDDPATVVLRSTPRREIAARPAAPAASKPIDPGLVLMLAAGLALFVALMMIYAVSLR